MSWVEFLKIENIKKQRTAKNENIEHRKRQEKKWKKTGRNRKKQEETERNGKEKRQEKWEATGGIPKVSHKYPKSIQN